MKTLHIAWLPENIDSGNIGEVSAYLGNSKQYPIQQISWADYPYKPNVTFSINCNDDHIFLKFFVCEETIRAVNFNLNGKVYEDSCVEFFIAFDGDENYYNLEFNCFGICRAGYGKSKQDRVLLAEDMLRKIKYQPFVIPSTADGLNEIYWELTLIIPIEVFHFSAVGKLKNKNARANFYKCGDLLPRPHFLSWCKITNDTPNFHLPQFFGDCVFAGG